MKHIADEHPCKGCGESTLNPEYCRECDIERSLDDMQCSVCERMRYRDDHQESAGFARSLWGERCVCDPVPPTVLERKETP